MTNEGQSASLTAFDVLIFQYKACNTKTANENNIFPMITSLQAIFIIKRKGEKEMIKIYENPSIRKT